MITVVGAATAMYATVLGGSERVGGTSGETNMQRYFRYLQNYNTGFMRSLQSNPDDRTTQCMDKTKATNLKINDMTDVNQYSDESVNQGEFLEKFQLAALVGMEQFEACGINEFLISLDGTLTNWSSLGGSLSAVTTQLITGYSKRDTSIYISTTRMSDAWSAVDWEELGLGSSLFISQILKFEAPDAAIQVEPTSN